ncbi:unnamed protein product [Schistosoma haematobium]|nr:unnamed protein product [Schistosoma haematobium]
MKLTSSKQPFLFVNEFVENISLLNESMYSDDIINNNNDNNKIPANIEFRKQQSEWNSEDSTVFPTSYYHPSSDPAAIHNVNNSNQENNTHVQSSHPQYDGDEEDEEVEINVELASMLEKCNRAYECPTVKINLMNDQYERRLTDLNSECTNLQNISQRDLKKTKEQVSFTVQELFSLTFLNS